MADTAAHLVDRVFPEVPVRQWVLTLPIGLRYRMAFDAGLATEVLGVFTEERADPFRRGRGAGAARWASARRSQTGRHA